MHVFTFMLSQLPPSITIERPRLRAVRDEIYLVRPAASLKQLFNRKIATKYKHEADKLAATKKWRDTHKNWAEYKGKPRKEAVANFRLKRRYAA